MKNLKRISVIVLALALALSLTIPGFAANAGYSDVAPGAWYAGAVEYVVEHGLMPSDAGGRFNPGVVTDRATLVTALWNMKGRPVVNYLMQFPDVPADEWYTEAVRWAASEHIVDGYTNGRFGPNDPVNREQIVTILWRYAGRPETESGQDFADEADISGYAAQAVDWARGNNVINGKPGNRFDPRGQAIRAQTAAILQKLPGAGGNARA